MESNQAKFESFVWEFELYQLNQLFDVLDEFLNDQSTQEFHLERKYKTRARFSEVSNKVEDSIHFLNGVQVFRRQMIVLLRTFLEQIIKDFLVNVFIGRPEKMARYLLLGEFQGDQSLDEFEKVLHDNKTAIIKELPKNAATRATAGKMQRVLNRVEEISGAKIEKCTKDTLIRLNAVRTHIVHEASNQEITSEFLSESVGAIADLVVALRKVCTANNILDVDEESETDDYDDSK